MSTGEREPVTRSKVSFTLIGFHQDASLRRYEFQRNSDGMRTAFTVGVDLALILRVGVHIQELPLLCRALLEQQAEGQEVSALTLTETEMRVHVESRPSGRGAAGQRDTLRLQNRPAAA
jgi:hypothetical protein